MEHASLALVVITLLQPCRAEISEILPGTWFSANAINDGYSPKPISEIFSTEPSPPFSPTKPIVVLPSFSSLRPEPEVTNLSTTSPEYSHSTPLPPSHTSTQYPTSNEEYKSSSPFPPPSSTVPPSSTSFPTSNTLFLKTKSHFTTSIDPFSSSTPFPPPSPTLPPLSFTFIPPSPTLPSLPPLPSFPPSSYQSTFSTFMPFKTSSLTTPAPTSSEFSDFSQTPRAPPQSPYTAQPGTTISMQAPTKHQHTSLPETTNSVQTPVQPHYTSHPETTFSIRNPAQPHYTLAPETTLRDGKSTLSHTQSVSFSLPPTQPTLPPPLFVPQTQTTAPPNYFVIYQNAPQAVQSFPNSNEVSQVPPQATPPVIVTTPSPSTTPAMHSESISPYAMNTHDAHGRPTVTFRGVPPTHSGRNPPCHIANSPPRLLHRNSSHPSLRVHPGAPKVPFVPKFKIRVVAPKGSITNVKINPSTTPKPRPTRRTKKPKKNTYDACLDSCKGRKDPLCAIPLATVIVDPKTLKGFTSICHMACYNSYRPDPYEKLVDGRCGKLRTRIIKVDDNQKVHREELKRSEYSVINTGPKTVVEFQHGETSHEEH